MKALPVLHQELLLLVAAAALIDSRQIQWTVQVVEHNQGLVLSGQHPKSTVDPVPVHFVAPYTNYLLQTSLVYSDDLSKCTSCALELSNIGGYPKFIYDPLQYSVLNYNRIQSEKAPAYDTVTSSWFLPLSTSKPGSASFTISSIGFSTPTLAKLKLKDATFQLSVIWFANTGASNDTFSNLLGPYSTSSYKSTSVVPSTFSYSALPSVSPMWLGTFSSHPMNSVIVTSDDFRTYGTLSFNLPSSVKAGIDACSGAMTDTAIKSGLTFSDSILLQTPGGMILGSREGSSVAWKNILTKCIDKISVHTQSPTFNSSRCSSLFAFDSANEQVFKYLENSSSFVELKNAGSESFGEYFDFEGPINFIAAGGSSTRCSEVEVLVRKNTTYMLASFDDNSQTWSARFVFPSVIPTDVERLQGGHLYNEGLSSNGASLNPYATDPSVSKVPLLLTSMAYHKTVGRDMFFWGNALLYSPNGGESIFLIHVLPNNIVTSFATSSDGAFAYLTDSNVLYYGQMGTSDVLPIETLNTNNRTAYQVFFDDENRLFVLTTTVDSISGQVGLSRSQIDYQSFIDFHEYTSGLVCPYSEITFDYSTDAKWTRNLVQSNDNLPSQIFVDRGQSYSFTMNVAVGSSYNLEDISVGLSLSSADWLEMDVVRTVDYVDRTVRYSVNVTDIGAIDGQFSPGANLQPTALKITMKDANLACKDILNDGEVKSTAEHAIVFYSGCPPYQSVSLNITSDMFHFCPNPEPDTPCVYWESEFQPYFILNDLATGLADTYKNKYTVKIIGGGLTRDFISRYTDEYIDVLNPTENPPPGMKLAWVSLTDRWSHGMPEFQLDRNEISFVCHPGSPCYKVVPKTGESPSYYFLMEMTTGPVDATIGSCLGGAILFSAYRRWDEHRQMGQVTPDDMFGADIFGGMAEGRVDAQTRMARLMGGGETTGVQGGSGSVNYSQAMSSTSGLAQSSTS